MEGAPEAQTRPAGDAGLVVLWKPGPPARPEPYPKVLRRRPEDRRPVRLPRLRPAPHFRDPSAEPPGADHVRCGTARAREADHDSPVVRAPPREQRFRAFRERTGYGKRIL